MFFELCTWGVNHICFVHVFKSSACSSNRPTTLESLVWNSICFKANVMLVIGSSRTTELLLAMTHFYEIDSQWTRCLVEIATSCHDCPITIRVRHSNSCSAWVRFFVIVDSQVIFDFIVNTFSWWRSATTDILMARWMELILFDDHCMVTVVFWLFTVCQQQLIRRFHNWTLSTIIFLLRRIIVLSNFATIFWWNLGSNSMWRTHYYSILFILNRSSWTSSFWYAANLLTWSISSRRLVFCVFHAIFWKFLANARFLRVCWGTRDSRTVDGLIVSIVD